MSLLDSFFYQPAHRMRLYPSSTLQQRHDHHPMWPALRMNKEEDAFDQFVRSVDDRFSGILANVHHPQQQTVDVHHEGAGGATTSKTKSNKFEMKISVQDFQPEDIKVKVQGNNVIVEAKREDKKEEEGMYAHSYREFKRSFTLPEGVDKKKLTSALSSGGILEIEAPLTKAIEQKKPEQKKQIDVQME